jgi:hypothetical protein
MRYQDIVVTMPGTSLRVVSEATSGIALVARLDYFQDQQRGPPHSEQSSSPKHLKLNANPQKFTSPAAAFR